MWPAMEAKAPKSTRKSNLCTFVVKSWKAEAPGTSASTIVLRKVLSGAGVERVCLLWNHGDVVIGCPADSPGELRYQDAETEFMRMHPFGRASGGRKNQEKGRKSLHAGKRLNTTHLPSRQKSSATGIERVRQGRTGGRAQGNPASGARASEHRCLRGNQTHHGSRRFARTRESRNSTDQWSNTPECQAIHPPVDATTPICASATVRTSRGSKSTGEIFVIGAPPCSMLPCRICGITNEKCACHKVARR